MASRLTHRPWFAHYDPQVPQHITYPSQTVVQMFEQTVKAYPHNTCTLYKGNAITYQQMDRLANRLASGFASLGVQPGDRLGLLMPNLPQFVLAYFAALKAGAVVVATNPLYKPAEVITQLNDASVQVLVLTAESYEAVKQFQAQTALQKLIVTQPNDLADPGIKVLRHLAVSGAHPSLPPGDSWLTDLLLRFDYASPPLTELSPASPALFQYSGGTTGTSKAAIALHSNLTANALQFRRWLHHAKDGEETMLMAIPLYHVYGMVVGMLVAVQLGARMILLPSPRDLHNILESIQQYQVTLFPGVPNIYQALINHPEVQAGKFDLSSIKACISGSAPLLPETKQRFEALTGGKLVEGYGLSEAPTATHCNPIDGPNPPGSIGLPLPDVDCRIVSPEDDRQTLTPGQPGELLIKGPQVMHGYHNKPEETALALKDGWLHTGDIARMDMQGYFYLVDRKKDVIKAGGFQVWPREVEEVLSRHPKVAECSVAGILDPQRGEVVKAWVVLLPAFSPPIDISTEQFRFFYHTLEQELRQYCRQELTSYKVPSLIEFRTELPKTPVGKVLRRELVRQHSADHSQESSF